METTELLPSEDIVNEKTEELGEETVALASQATEYRDIQTQLERSDAVSILTVIKLKLRDATELREFFVKPVRDLATRYREKFKPPIAALEDAEKAIKRKIGEYDMRLTKERMRREREAIEAAHAKEREQEKKAKALEKKGEPEAAQAVRSVPVIPIAPAPAPAPISRGTTTRVKYEPQIEDEDAVPRRWLMVDMRGLTLFATRYKGQLPPKVPGVRWQVKPIVTHRG